MNFRTLIPGILLLLSLSGCSRFTQVVYVAPTNNDIQSINHFYEYENQDLKVVYWFWAEHGIMSFLVWNKTDKPLYIDWKKSAMVNNGKRMSYYTNSDVSNYKSYGNNYSLEWLDVFNEYYGKASHKKLSRAALVKGDRISFIAPKSYITQAFYNLTANIYFDINDRNTEEDFVNFCKVYVSRSNQEISFRNYLTYSNSENFETESHVDNEFHLDKVVTMQKSFFLYKDKDGYWANDWERPSRFFIENLKWQDIYK